MGKMSDKHIEIQEEKIEIWDGEKFRDTTKEPIVHIDDWKSQIEESLQPFIETVKEYGIHTFTNPDTSLEVGPSVHQYIICSLHLLILQIRRLQCVIVLD